VLHNQYFQPRIIWNSFLTSSKNSYCIETQICIFLGEAIQLGNPLLDPDINVINHEFLWSHGDISDESLILRKTMQ
ncbi:hypothetical protein Goshw_013166, partial [Gossypium schwendimanii]|nr:hypothetical protein [Gossypium schwendimanii]